MLAPASALFRQLLCPLLLISPEGYDNLAPMALVKFLIISIVFAVFAIFGFAAGDKYIIPVMLPSDLAVAEREADSLKELGPNGIKAMSGRNTAESTSPDSNERAQTGTTGATTTTAESGAATADGTATVATGANAGSSNLANSGPGIVTRDNVNVRSAGTLTAQSVMKLMNNAHVLIIGYRGGWYNVRLRGGSEGWIRNDCMRPMKENEAIELDFNPDLFVSAPTEEGEPATSKAKAKERASSSKKSGGSYSSRHPDEHP
jgi:hypothetical protein